MAPVVAFDAVEKVGLRKELRFVYAALILDALQIEGAVWVSSRRNS
jgi:hypothetical protein